MARIVAMVLGLVGTVAGSVSAVQREVERPSDQAAQVALRYFESVQVRDFDTLLRELRRPAPPASVRAWVIKNLPPEGALTPTAEEAAKLHVLLPVLTFHVAARGKEAGPRDVALRTDVRKWSAIRAQK